MFLLLFAYYFYHGGCLWKSSKESLKPLKKRTKRLLICATVSAFGHLLCLPGKLAIAKYIKPIADFLGVSVHYLLTGEEAPARKLTTAEEDELLALYRALPQNKQFEFIGELKGFLKAYTESQKYLDKEKRLSV